MAQAVSVEDEHLTCPICLELLHTPVMLPCCQQTFCKRCLKQALRRSSSCPLCRASTRIEDALPNRSVEGLLSTRKGGDIESAIPYWPAQPKRRNLFMPSRRVHAYGWYGWWRANGPCVRCICVVGAVAVLMLFLRVEEEEYAKQTGMGGRFHFHSQTGGNLPALASGHLHSAVVASALGGT